MPMIVHVRLYIHIDESKPYDQWKVAKLTGTVSWQIDMSVQIISEGNPSLRSSHYCVNKCHNYVQEKKLILFLNSLNLSSIESTSLYIIDFCLHI